MPTYFKVNNILRLVRACQQGLGIAALPDYLVEENNRLVQLFGRSDSIQLDTYFVYPEELKTVAQVQVFRDFVVSKAQRWPSDDGLLIRSSYNPGVLCPLSPHVRHAARTVAAWRRWGHIVTR